MDGSTPLRRVLYRTEATADGGRDGLVRLSEGGLALTLERPPVLGGPATGTGDGANPEQLFAMGYAGCFHGSIQANAERLGLDASGSRVVARVSLGTVGTGGFGLAVDLLVELPAVAEARRVELAEAAHASCPYSRAVRGNIEVTVRIGAIDVDDEEEDGT